MKWMILIVTNLCNLKCKTCLREFGPKHNLDLTLLQRLLPQFKHAGYTHISLTGGEPGLHPQFNEIIDAIARAGFGLGMVTNGVNLSLYDHMMTAYHDKIMFVATSLDGSTAAVNDAIRGAGTSRKTTKAVKYFVEQGIYTKVSVCLNKTNRKDLKRIIRRVSAMKANHIILGAAIKTEGNKKIILNDREKQEIVKEINACKPGFPNLNFFITTSLGGGNGGVEFCAGINLTELTVNHRGELVFCCDTIKDGAMLGSLATTTFDNLACKARGISGQLKEIRKSAIDKGLKIEGFNTCEFCNHCLSGFIRKKGTGEE